MKVTKDRYDKELQPTLGSLKMLAGLLSSNTGARIFHSLTSLNKGQKIKGLHSEQRFIPSKHGGSDIRIRIFKPLDHKGKLPAFLFYHGGGYILGNPEGYLKSIEKFIKTRPCVVIAPDYRKSIKNPFPAGFNDCYDTLIWVKENSDKLGVFDKNFILGGHSAGGGLTAAVMLRVRDEQSAKIAFQMPIYPMIDDRQTNPSAIEMDEVPVWNAKTNANAWKAYLRELNENKKEIPAYAAPSRNDNYTDFPPTITFVGDLEPFKDETIAYVNALKNANIPVEFELFEGAFHGFDQIAPKSQISQNALNFTYQKFGEFYDKYVK